MKLSSRRLAWSVAAAAGLLIGAAGVGAAATAVFGSDGTLHGCAKRFQGTLRLVETGASCSANEQAVRWNVQGPAGLQGPEGRQGGRAGRAEGRSGFRARFV